MNGTSLPETIKQLSKEKITTLFIDGDRGGLLIAKDAVANAKIDFIAQAPIGREVEELSSKEVITSLRNKKSATDFLGFSGAEHRRKQVEQVEETEKEISEEIKIEEREPSESERIIFQKMLFDLIGTKEACLVDSSFKVLRRLPISKLHTLYRYKAYALVLDGTATNSIVRIAEEANCKYLVAKNFTATKKTKVNLVSV